MRLKDLIRQAFSDLKRPTAGSIANRDAVPISLEALAVEAFFSDYDWSAVTKDVLAEYRGDQRACLYFMTPNAFLYYYPAYMCIVLDDANDMGGFLYPVVSIACRGEEKEDLFDFMLHKYDVAKRQCVGLFLSSVHDRFVKQLGWMQPTLDPRSAAERYWLSSAP